MAMYVCCFMTMPPFSILEFHSLVFTYLHYIIYKVWCKHMFAFLKRERAVETALPSLFIFYDSYSFYQLFFEFIITKWSSVYQNNYSCHRYLGNLFCWFLSQRYCGCFFHKQWWEELSFFMIFWNTYLFHLIIPIFLD